MLFNSYVFLFGFLPVVLLGYEIAGRFHRKAVVLWLGLASLMFYGFQRPRLLYVLGTSVLMNYFFASLISRKIPNRFATNLLLWSAILLNLGLLCWFKYLIPTLRFADEVMGLHHTWGRIVLPLGISFFTFTQIAYLVDLKQGSAAQQDFPSYLLFVTFFPHLIAGPILHHKDIMPQFQQDRRYRLQFNDLAVGFSWFTMGLFKKAFLADSLAPAANVVYASHGAVTTTTAWVGALAYSLQLYFDFSGYCDMACGLARMLSIDFPLNFSSPYKATNVIDFWQRWHITLTQYITSYLYSPVQFWISERRQNKGQKVSRKAQATLEGFAQMIALPTIFTMFIAGIWHGAGTQFIIFGVLHGVYLTIVHAYRLFRKKDQPDTRSPLRKRINHGSAVLVTFLAVLAASVFFRAPSTADAFTLLSRMAHLSFHPYLIDVEVADLPHTVGFIVAGFIICWTLPNTQQILARFKPGLSLTLADQKKRLVPIFWTPNVQWGLALGVLMIIALVNVQDPASFLYFQF